MTDKPEPDIEQAWIALHRAHRRLLERVESALKSAGLPPLDWYDVLLELTRESGEGLRQYQVGERVLLSKHNLSRLIDRLERMQLVRRHACAEDGRGNLLRITTSGKAMLDAMWPVYGGVIAEAFGSKLEHNETIELSRLLRKLMDQSGDT